MNHFLYEQITDLKTIYPTSLKLGALKQQGKTNLTVNMNFPYNLYKTGFQTELQRSEESWFS